MNPIHSSSYPLPPSAEVQEEHLHHLDTERIDPFYYMKDKGDPRLVEYLESENKYTSEVMASTKSLQEQIYQEIVGRMKEDDQSYPTLRRGYYYYTRTEKGKQYPTHYRMRQEDFDRKWEDCPTAIEGGDLLFDVNQLAEGSDAYIFAGYSVSPNNQLAAYFSNTTGSYAEFDLHLRDLTTGTDRSFTLHGISSLAWAEDSETIYYSLISTSSSTTSEEYYLSSSGEDREPKLFLPRQQDVRYSILSHREKFFVYYKDKEHLNGMVYVSPKDQVGDPTQWRVFVPHREDVRLDSIGVYREHVALEERREGLTEIRILSHEGEPLPRARLHDQPQGQFHLRGYDDPLYLFVAEPPHVAL